MSWIWNLHTYADVCNVRWPQAMSDVISSIGIGTAAADNIGYQTLARYQSNPSNDTNCDNNNNNNNNNNHNDIYGAVIMV